MAHEIVMIQQMGDALRNTGYKSIESAASEIIDNSIEAGASDILILVSEAINPSTGRKYVSEFVFLDNGIGMNLEQLESCLGIGFSTRRERKGMGRFGVGLPQASLHVCPTVDVYSWQKGYENSHKVFLDINKVRSGEQTQIEDPLKSSIPTRYEKFLTYKTIEKNYDFMQSGTLVHWKNCDRVSPKTIHFLFQTLQFALGQKFRHLIKEKTHNIKLISLDNEEFSYDIMPNDPLFLMNPNYVLGNLDDPENIKPRVNKDCTESLFEPYANELYPDGIVPFKVKYIDRETQEVKESVVTLTFSKVRDVFYDRTAMSKDPGGTQMGKHVAKMEGISVVRAGREIDFGMFDFYKNINHPEHRWWGCEIFFMPELDEAFGVANNKQHVELKELSPTDYVDDEVKPMWLQLYSVIHNTIMKIYNENKQTRHKSRSLDDIATPTSSIVNSAEQNNDIEGASDKARHDTPQEELIEKNKEALKDQGVEEVSDDQVIAYMNNKVNIVYKDLGRGPFFDYSFSLGSCYISINQSHVFYQQFLTKIDVNPDMKTAFELFIASLVKTVDEMVGDEREVSDNLVADWNVKLRKYITEQNGYGKTVKK